MSHFPEARFSSFSSQKPKYLGQVILNMVKFSSIIWSSLNVRNLRWQRRGFCNFSSLPLLQFLAIICVDERAQTGSPCSPEGWRKHSQGTGKEISPWTVPSFSGLSEKHPGERAREKAQPEILLVFFFSPFYWEVSTESRDIRDAARARLYRHLVLLNRKTKVPMPPPSAPKPAPQGFCSRKLAPSFPADPTGTGNSHTGTRPSADQRVSMKK